MERKTKTLILNSELRADYFSPHISSRLRYIVAELFKESALLTDNVEVYLSKEGACINYSNQSIDKGIQVIPVTLLKETEISKQEIQIQRWQDLPVFFSGSGDIPLIFLLHHFTSFHVTKNTWIMRRINMADSIIATVLLSSMVF